jgi:WD40 repeat protein/serine/threonine protein kinase
MPRVAPAIERLTALPDGQRTLGGAFKLVHQLGRGGFAPVWLAKEVYGASELRTVAVKLFAADDEGRGRSFGSGSSSGVTWKQREHIFEEARALCQVEHPNVVRFHSLHHDTEKNVIGLVMEYVRGTPLDARLAARLNDTGKASLPLDETLAVGVAVASALAAVHQVGLVHRDVKPANVVEAANVYKLIDFGIAAAERRARPAEARHEERNGKQKVVLDDLPIEIGTKASTFAATAGDDGTADVSFSLTGTLGYIDPYCVATMSTATPASDLYGLGATLYECATGGVPAAVAARQEMSHGMKGEVLDGRARAVPLALVAPEVPASFARLVDALVDPAPDKRPRSAEAVAWELERIRREMTGRARPLPPEDVGPFRGLGRFEEKDRDVYFGRAVEIAASLEMARSRGLLALIGPSGSGKSSLARAGVLPAIGDGGLGKWPKAWDTAVTTPGADPKAAITSSLAGFVEHAATHTPESLIAALAERAQATGRGVVLLVDQLEELVTLANEEGRAYAVRFLAQLGAQVLPGVRGVVAARRDLLDSLLALGELGRALTRGTLLVSPMSESTWGEVLDQALGAYGYALEDEALRAELLAELHGTEAAMPLVQFALTELWKRRNREKKIVPRSALAEIGGIAGALEMHAEATLARDAESLEVARPLLLAMTTPQGLRRIVDRASLVKLHARAAVVLERLEASRLVVEDEAGVTIAHEALLKSWSRLRKWIDAARADRALAEEIEREATLWGKERSDERVWKKRRLLAAEDLAKQRSLELSKGARDFVRAGRRVERRGRVALGILLAGVLAVALGGGAKYVHDTRAARKAAEAKERETRVALRDALAAQAEALAVAKGDPAESATMALRAIAIDMALEGKPSDKSRYALSRAALLAPSPPPAVKLPHPVNVSRIVFSPDSKRILTVADDRVVRLWDAKSGALVAKQESDHECEDARFVESGVLVVRGKDPVLVESWDPATGTTRDLTLAVQLRRGPRLSPFGDRLASASGGLWDIGAFAHGRTDAAGVLIGPLATDAYADVDFSFDGSGVVVTSGYQHELTTWDARTGANVTRAPLPKLPGGEEWAAINVSPSGAWAVLYSDDAAVLWNPRAATRRDIHRTGRLREGRTGGPFPGFSVRSTQVSQARTAAFASDESRVAVGDTGGQVALVDVTTGDTLRRFPGSGTVERVAFSSDGSRILSNHADATRVWDATTGALLAQLANHESRALSDFSPDGAAVAAVGTDHAARVWYARSPAVLSPLVRTRLLDWSPENNLIALGDLSDSVEIWDERRHERVARCAAGEAGWWWATLSRDGTRVAVGLGATHVKFFDASTGAPGSDLTFDHPAYAAAWSDDGRTVLVTGGDVATLVDASAAKIVRRFMHEEYMSHITFSRDGSRVAAAGSKQVFLFDARSDAPAVTTPVHGIRDLAPALSTDGTRVAVATDFGAQIIDARSGVIERSVGEGEGIVFALDFSRDGAWLLTGNASGAHVWSVATGKEIARTPAIAVQQATFSGDGSSFVTLGEDGAVRVWESTNARLRHVLDIPGATVKMVRLSSNGDRAMIVDDNGSFRVFELRFDSHLLLACVVAGDAARTPELRDLCAAQLAAAAKLPALW